MKKLLITAAALGLASCASMSTTDNSKPYTCAQYNAARAKVAANPSQAYMQPDTLFFNKVNLVGFKSALSKHPNREETMRYINDTTDLQALQCRTAPDAVIRYTAEQVTPASVRLGYRVDFPSGEPAAARQAAADFRMGKPIADEKGMEKVKEFIQNCAAGSAPARACKLGGL